MLHQTLTMQCLQDLAFTPTVKNVLVKYKDGMIAKYGNLAMNIREEVESLGRNRYIQSERDFPSRAFLFYSSTRSLSQLSSRCILELDFRCTPGGR